MNYVVLLKRSLLLFWAVWLSVVFLSNLFDAGKAAGLIGESWAFASGNWEAIQGITARYGTPDVVNALMFTGVILWEAVAAVLFWCAFWTFRGRQTGCKAVYLAFTSALALWAAFIVSDEIFIAYAFEATHLRLFIAYLVTLLAIELLPETCELDAGVR